MIAAEVCSLAGMLDELRPRVPAALVSDAAWTRVQAMAGQVPAALPRAVGLECRLAADARTDLALGIERGGGALLSGGGSCGAPGTPEHPAWERIRSFCLPWAAGLAAEEILSMWLEFDDAGDAAEGPGSLPVPGIFIEIAPALRGEAARTACLAFVTRAIGELVGEHAAASLSAPLRHCFSALPPGACVPGFGFFPGRAAGAVRVNVSCPDATRLVPYLQAVGWPGPADVLRSTLAEAARARGRTACDAPEQIHFDLAPHVLPRLGLEYFLARTPQANGTIAEARFLDALVSRGLCTPEKRDALHEWPGTSLAAFAHTLWVSRVRRLVHHVKLVCEGGTPVEAKAYLGIYQV